MKKHIIIFFLLLCSFIELNAQIQVSLNVDSNPTPELSEWVNRNNLAILTVTNTDPNWEVEYRIKVEMYKDGILMFETNDNVVSQTLEVGTVTFLADEIIPYNAIVFRNNSFQQSILQTGMLPAGEYSFCLSLLKSNDGAVISTSPISPLCKPMIMTEYQMPELINPIANVNFDSQLAPTITFNWTPVTPAPPADLGVKYILAVSEVNSGQSSPTQAFLVNTPIIEEEILIGSQFNWPTDIDVPDELTQYVWSVKPVSTSNENNFQQAYNGFVVPQTFTITPSENTDFNSTNKNQQLPDVMNCGVNPFLTNNPLFFTYDENGQDRHDVSRVELNGLITLQNQFLPQYPGSITQTEHLLTTYIDWGCTHDRDNVPFNSIDSKSHNYNTVSSSVHRKGENPSTVKVHMELRHLVTGKTCSVEVSKNLEGCEFPSQSDFESAVAFVNYSSNNPLHIELSQISAFTMELEQKVKSRGTFSSIDTELYVNFDGTHDEEGDYERDQDVEFYEVDGMMPILKHTYDIDCINGSDIPREICLTYVTERNIEGQIIKCEKTYCIQLPDETLVALDELITTSSYDEAQNEVCKCLDDSNVTIPDMEMRYTANDDSDEHTLYIPDADTALQSIIDCMASQELFDGSENMNGHPEYNYQPDFFTGTVTYNWQTSDTADNASNIHTYNLPINNDDSLPEAITVTFHIVNTEANIDCSFTKDVPVPQNSFNDDNEIASDNNNSSTNTIVVGDTIHAGYNHEFEIKLTEIDTLNNKFNGKGTAYVGFLGARVAVAFNQITLDPNKNLLTGNIIGEIYEDPAPVYPKDWGLEIVANNGAANNVANNVANWGNDIVGDVVNWTNDTAGDAVDLVNNSTGTSINTPVIDPLAPIPDGPLTDNTTPVKFPLGVNYANGDQFAITEMVFRPNLSEFNLVAAKNTPQSWQAPGEDPQLIGFIAKNIKFHPNNIVTPPERIELIEDVEVGNMNNKITFKFIRPTNPSSGGCYIEWDENGFSQFGIELESTFTRDWFVPVPDDGISRSKATFVATVQDWDELILTGNLEKSEIVDTQAMTIFAGNISLDMSDTLNPQNLQSNGDFPSNYAGETTMLFRGFHMEELTVEMPDCWQTNTNGVPTISVYDMIINDTGLTMVAEATNVAAFRGANVADLIASIDTVHVDIRGSSFHNAYVKGKIGLPVSKADSIQNPLKYNALFTTANSQPTFQLTIEPTGPINATLMKGVMELDQTSNIVASVSKTPNYDASNSNSKKYKKTFQSTLNGNFVWDDVKLGPVKHVNMDLGFQGIEMNYNNTLQNNKFNFNAGSWAFASPQKFLSNFPVTIENIGFTEKTSTGNQLMHGDLNFDVIFNLTDDIGGQTKMAVELAIEDNPGGSGAGKFKPEYINTGIDDITIYAHLPAVSIDGTLEFRNDDPVYGNGFKGTLNAAFKTPNIGISALAEFGNTNYLNNGATYRYWRVEAAAKFTPGLPFLPGIAFYGFGGGAFKNMESSIVPSSGSVPAHYDFSPKKGNLGFKVEATIGAAAKAESFNADVGLNGQFSSSDGLINIGFTGDFYIGGPLTPQPEREKSQVQGSVIADYNFPNKHFFMNVDASINTEKIQTPYPVNLNVDVNGTTNLWHFKFGVPDYPNTVNVFGISLYEYLTFGNNIDSPTGFTNTFKSGWAGVFNGAQPGIPVTTGVDSNSALGKGFAFGIGFEFDKKIDKHVFNGYHVNLDVAAGAELNLSMIQKTGVNCKDSSKEFGLNGWRARGSVGFYGAVDAYVSKNSNRWDLLNIKAGGWVDGKFPGPTYVAGEVRGEAKVGHFTTWIHTLGDCKKGCGAYHVEHGFQWKACTHKQHHYVLNKSFQSDFEWGTDCNGADAVSNTPTVQGDAVAEQSQKLIKYVHPEPTTVTYNFPITTPLAIKFGLTPNEVFDVPEQQSNGAVLTRTFKLERTVNLLIDNPDNGTFSNISASLSTGKMLIKHDNNLGEELYIVGSNMANSVAQMTSLAPIPNSGLGGNGTQPQQQVASMQIASNGSSGAGIYSNTQLQNQQAQGLSKIPFPPQPTQPPAAGPDTSASYDNLPPAEDPIVNALTVNKTYKLIVVATLKEFKNNAWIDSGLTETKTKVFRTGPMKLVTANASSSTKINKVNTGTPNTNSPNANKGTFNTRTSKMPNRNKAILLNNKAISKEKDTSKKDSKELKKVNTKTNFKKN